MQTQSRSRRLVTRNMAPAPGFSSAGKQGPARGSGLSRRERAEKKYPEYDWAEYTRLLKVRTARLGQDRRNRRLGRMHKMEAPLQELKTEEKALMAQGHALVKSAWTNLEEVKAAVYAAYKGGNDKLDNHEMNAIALIAFNMALDPSPGVGHLYAWKKGNKFIVMIGYQGYLHKAQQQRQFVHDTREMTESERAAHGLGVDDVGAICELYDSEKAAQWRTMGMEPRPVKGMAIWRKGDNVPTSKSPLWVAEKNATKDAIRRLGLGFGSLVIPELPGFEYDREDDTFSRIDDGETVEGEIVSDAAPEPQPEVAEAPAKPKNGRKPMERELDLSAAPEEEE